MSDEFRDRDPRGAVPDAALPHGVGPHSAPPIGEGRARVLADAAARGLDVETVARPEASSLDEAARMLGIDPGDILKSLVVRRADDDFLFVLVPGGRRIDWPRLRAVVAANRLVLPDPQVALEATGFERGTITPLGSTRAWPVIVDRLALGRRVSLGAGEHGWSLFVDADALVASFGALVAEISSPQ